MGLLFQQMHVQHCQNDDWQEETEVHREKPVPVQLCTPQIPNEMPC
jgi:hypothetical protein